MVLRDKEGYLYYTPLKKVTSKKKKFSPSKFGNNNPFTIYNIKLYLKIRKINIELISNKFINTQTDLIFKDNEGYFYTTTSNRILSEIPDRFNKSNKYTIQNIKLWCDLNNKPFKLLSDEYSGNNIKLKWQCLKQDCGEVFEAIWGNISQGKGCGFCVGRQAGLSNCLATNNPELASEWHPTLNGNLTPYNVTQNSGKKVWWLCVKCHKWKTSISHRILNGCPYCSGRYATKETNLLIKNYQLACEWNYEKNNKRPEDYTPKSNKKVWWKCKECTHEWKTKISDRANNHGCPACNQSKGEKELERVLLQYNIFHDSQYCFENLVGLGGGVLKYDKSVFFDKNKTQLKMLIEFDGKQHYEWTKWMMTKEEFKQLQRHDKLKNQYCISHNIPLIRIPYWEIDNIEIILTDILVHNNMDSKFIVK